MNEDLKKYKLYFLQIKYMRIMDIISKLENQFSKLQELNFLDQNQIIDYSNKLYNIIKNINTEYNAYINYYFDNNNTDIDILINKLNNTPPNEILEIIKSFEHDIPNNLFKEINNTIIDLIKNYGYINIKDMLDILYPSNNFSNINNIIDEINSIVIPIRVNQFNVNTDNNILYWRLPNKYKDEDYLERTREVWIKIEEKDNMFKYIKIDILFKIDYFSSKTKTSQIKSPYLHKIKTNVITKIEQNNNIDINFVKTFIKHDYFGNIYCMELDNYMEYLKKSYIKYTKLVESTFVNIMKEFVSNENIKHMYNIIFLLLFGTEDMIDIGGLLLGLIKEKNSKKNINLYDYIFNNITYYLQSKIKKSNNNIKQSINKLKHLNIEEVDYKKLLVINKNIPNNIKVMVLEKIDEMKASNNEYYKQLLYVKTIINFPWSSPNDDILYESMKKNNISACDYLNNIENKLMNSCYGHTESKKLLLQMIAKRISNQSSTGKCFGLVSYLPFDPSFK